MRRAPIIASVIFLCLALDAHAADVFLRFRVLEPAGEKHKVMINGWRHEDPWYLPTVNAETTGDAWSDWLDLSKWPWHGRLNRAGGIAEWPAIRMAVAPADPKHDIAGCALNVQLADHPDPASVIHDFTEKSASDTIGFLAPTPLREHAKEFETGSQMTDRQLAWAKEASGGKPAKLKDFTFLTATWGPYDPALASQTIETLKMLGFNIIGNADLNLLRKNNMRSYQTTWIYGPDPDEMDKGWKTVAAAERKRGHLSDMAHWVLGDEVQTLGFVDVKNVDAWFRDYLHAKNVTEKDLGQPLDQVHYPAKAMYAKTLPRDADLPTRRLMYHAAKFGQWWSAKQLRHNSDLVHGSFPGAQTETLPSDHAFLNAWGPPHIGMSYRVLDLFELGAQRAVDQLSAEDWIGLNHMYGPDYTWTGAQTCEYFASLCRCAAQRADEPMLQRALITVSDDDYLRLKTYSGIGQGIRSFFFWTFGPTYIGTENYWSDLRSEYDGIAKLSRVLEKAEPVLVQARPVRDPVAILYSVSHDIWHSDDPAAFVEKRLTWHALRHLHVQPDFLREEDVEAGKLKDYKVLYIADTCITRAASAKIDEWVKAGGVVYLSAAAATRDEFYEPYIPAFATRIWPADATTRLKKESHEYNERKDLPSIKPMTTASVDLPPNTLEIPVLGYQLALNSTIEKPVAHFADSSPAGAMIDYGRGKVIAFGFLPMLAYAQGAHFKPTTLEETWPAAPRALVKLALDAAKIQPAADANVPVVETSFLAGDKGSALVLANYTYHPIDSLKVDLKTAQTFTRATSTEGSDVKLEPIPGGVRLRVPLKWTDIILLE